MATTITIHIDLFSAWRKQYARRGDTVAVVACHGNVLIVEGPLGRFPVNIQNTSYTQPNSHELERKTT